MRSIQTTFIGGEMSPEMLGHTEDPKLRAGLQAARNYMIAPSGMARRRPGSRFVSEHVNSAKRVRLLPFRFSLDQTMCVQVGEGYFRFHTQGANLLFVTPRTVSSVDTTAETITTSTAHSFALNDQVRLFNTGGAVPAGLTAGTTYYVNPTSTTAFQLSTSAWPGAAVNLTGSGSGTTRVYKNSESPALYIGSKSFTTISWLISATNTTAGNEFITTSTTHDLALGDKVVITGGAGTGITAGTVYYAIPLSTTTLRFATTYANAIGGTYVDLVGAFGIVDRVFRPDRITIGAGHGLTGNGQPINFTTSATLPAGLSAGPTYYAIYVNSTDIALATTYAGAIATTTDVVITNSAAGTHTFHYVYEAGELVTNINVPQGFFVCVTRNPQSVTPGTTSHWYQLPADGTLELPNTFQESELSSIDFAGVGDTLRLVHPNHAPLDLRRISATSWSVTPATVAPTLSAPIGAAVTTTYGRGLNIASTTAATPTVIKAASSHGFTALIDVVCIVGRADIADGVYVVTTTPAADTFTVMTYVGGSNIGCAAAGGAAGVVQRCSGTTDLTHNYKVTAVDASGLESTPASVTSGVNNLLVDGAYNTITWTAVTGAVRYHVYKEESGLYGYIGSSDTTSFKDDNIDPDMSILVPVLDSTLASNNPGAVAFFAQRTLYAGFTSYPQRLLMSRTGSDGDFSYHLPLLDSDRFNRDIAAMELCRVQFLVPTAQLVILTDSTEFRAATVDTEVVSPKSLECRPFSYVGSAKVKPLVTNGSIVFVGSRGHVHELGFSTEAGGFVSNDLCYRAAHLFDGLTVTAAARQRAPWSINWFVSSDGKLLGHTYVPSENVGAWHRHDTTNGTVEDVCVVAEGVEDAVYLSVKRTINGVTKRYIECIRGFAEPTRTSAFFVDCGLAYSGSPATSFSGLSHLEGQVVDVLADGVYIGQKTVTSGAISITKPASTVAVGLPIVADIQVPPWAAQIEALGQGRPKNVGKAVVRVRNAGPFKAGPDFANLTSSNPIAYPNLTNGDVDVSAIGTWARDGSICLRVTNPLPCTFLAVVLSTQIGG